MNERCYVSFAAVCKQLGETPESAGKPMMRLLVSGTKLDATTYQYGDVTVRGEQVMPQLLAEMCAQAKAGQPYLIESHSHTLRLGVSHDAFIEDAGDGDQELYVDFELFADNPMVGFLLAEQKRGYMPQCSVGLFVRREVEWDAAAGGYVGRLYEGKFEHVALTRPGHAAYPDAELEAVYLVDTMAEALKSLSAPSEHKLAELEAKRDPTTIQTLIFDKGKFSAAGAKAWAKDHGFAAGGIDETAESYRLRQRDPKSFQEGSFRTITLTDGVKAVIGRKRKVEKEWWRPHAIKLATRLGAGAGGVPGIYAAVLKAIAQGKAVRPWRLKVAWAYASGPRGTELARITRRLGMRLMAEEWVRKIDPAGPPGWKSRDARKKETR